MRGLPKGVCCLRKPQIVCRITRFPGKSVWRWRMVCCKSTLHINPRTDLLSAPYRDDNRYFWEFEEFDFDKSQAAGFETIKQVRKHVSVMEFANEVECRDRRR